MAQDTTGLRISVLLTKRGGRNFWLPSTYPIDRQLDPGELPSRLVHRIGRKSWSRTWLVNRVVGRILIVVVLVAIVHSLTPISTFAAFHEKFAWNWKPAVDKNRSAMVLQVATKMLDIQSAMYLQSWSEPSLQLLQLRSCCWLDTRFLLLWLLHPDQYSLRAFKLIKVTIIPLLCLYWSSIASSHMSCTYGGKGRIWRCKRHF